MWWWSRRDLVKRLPFIDEDNMGVWGWGYGGYVAIQLLAKDQEGEGEKRLFKCGIAVAPITKWEFHSESLSCFPQLFILLISLMRQSK